MNGFLRAFASIGHALESVSQIIAPIISVVNPTVGGLISQATTAAVMAENVITAPGSGSRRQGVVNQTTAATVDIINSILKSQGKQPIPPSVIDAVNATTKNVVDALNTVAVATSVPQAGVATAGLVTTNRP